MNTSLADFVGTMLVLVSVAGTTTALYGRTRRGPGRAALALAWVALGILGIAALLAPVAPPAFALGGLVIAGGVFVCAAALAILRRRELSDARRRDAALGQPPMPSAPSRAVIVLLSGIASLALCGALIAPWMLVAAASVGIAPARIPPGLLANLTVAVPIVWVVVSLLATVRVRLIAADAELLRRGVEARVADVEVAGYRDGFANGREDGYRHAAFGTSWE